LFVSDSNFIQFRFAKQPGRKSSKCPTNASTLIFLTPSTLARNRFLVVLLPWRDLRLESVNRAWLPASDPRATEDPRPSEVCESDNPERTPSRATHRTDMAEDDVERQVEKPRPAERSVHAIFYIAYV
jgi:hypothetical protein